MEEERTEESGGHNEPGRPCWTARWLLVAALAVAVAGIAAELVM